MSESKAPRRPGGRRPIPPLIFLVVLAVLAVAVWWQVIRKDEDRKTEASSPCTLTASEQQLADLSNMANIKVHVLNGSTQNGLAASIQAEFTGRGFTVLDIGNTTSGEYPNAGKVEYGAGNDFQAKVVAANLTNFQIERSNQITDGTITIIAGQEYGGMVDANIATEQVKKLIDAQAKVVAGCEQGKK